MRDTVEIYCPYCGEVNEIFIDYSGGRVQKYQEDCQVCCQPWEIQVELMGNVEPAVIVLQINE